MCGELGADLDGSFSAPFCSLRIGDVGNDADAIVTLTFLGPVSCSNGNLSLWFSSLSSLFHLTVISSPGLIAQRTWIPTLAPLFFMNITLGDESLWLI